MSKITEPFADILKEELKDPKFKKKNMKPTSINWKVKSLVCTQERFLALVITLISDYCLENRFTLIYKKCILIIRECIFELLC